MIFDTHAHYDDAAFEADRETALGQVRADGVDRILNCGAGLVSSVRSLELAHSHDFVYAAVGVHPDEAGELLEDGEEEKYDLSEEQRTELEQIRGRRRAATSAAETPLEYLRGLALQPKVLAIGEIGLDYHWDRWPRALQRDTFIRQWELALELGLPIEIHSRDAAEDTMDIVRSMYERGQAAGRGLRVDMHCYSYSPEQAREYVKLGLYFGIGGVVTFKNAKKLQEVVRELPLERILLETDCPYLAPEPYRGQRNCSAYLTGVAARIAELKGITEAEVYAQTAENAEVFFGMD